MLEVKQFDTTSVQELVQTTKERLMKEADVPLYDSDLEVVLLELWALMIDMQNYTMDITTDEMKLAMATFLFDLDLKPHCASGILIGDPVTSLWVLRNTLFHTIPKLPYTSVEPTYMQENAILSLSYHQEQYPFPITRPIIITDEKPLSITLSNPLKVDRPCSIYVRVKEANAKPERDFVQSRLVIFYESVHGLCEVELRNDETYGCLTSGIITFTIHKEHRLSASTNAYELRIMVKDTIMDAFPCIYGIFLNPIKVKQVQSLAVTYHISLNQTIRLQDALAISGHISVMVKTDACLRPCAFTKTIEEDGVILTLQHTFSEEEKELVVIIQDQSLAHDGILASTTGVSMQQVPLPYEDIMNMTLLIKQSDGWHEAKVYDQGTFQAVKPYGAWLCKEDHVLQFGCGKDFMIPKRAIDHVVISELSITKGSLGNINAHVLSSGGYLQPYAMQGGSDEKNLDEWVGTIPELLHKQHPATTCADVCEVIRHFPGNHLTHRSCRIKQLPTKDTSAFGYDILIKGEKSLHKDYIAQLSIWLQDRLPLGIPFDVIDAKLLQVALDVSIIPSSSLMTKEMIQDEIMAWMKSQSSCALICTSSLIQALKEAHVAYQVQSCHFIVDGKQIDQLRIPKDTICELFPMHIQMLAEVPKGNTYE